ncbi:hypothetical protein BS50DRAFT_583320 [Corynespora cassiicola Philippines]|uniref:Uncharacterized protein n=1 Tax=Corynespora cassiicola Philippines TaxID=1448308 RepID=A0A2T2P1W9_CORCC|nr:hypothetical protein BS50DRAFT_583320 [Corynespora cassiicola Philippines]
MARILPKCPEEPLEAFIPDVITVFSRIVKQTFLGPEAKDCLLLALAARALVLHHWFKNASSSRTSSRWDRSNYYSNYQPTQVAMSLPDGPGCNGVTPWFVCTPPHLGHDLNSIAATFATQHVPYLPSAASRRFYRLPAVMDGPVTRSGDSFQSQGTQPSLGADGHYLPNPAYTKTPYFPPVMSGVASTLIVQVGFMQGVAVTIKPTYRSAPPRKELFARNSYRIALESEPLHRVLSAEAIRTELNDWL